jgi:hypothetical protein
MPLPFAHVEHHLPERVRLRVPSQRGDTAFFAATAEQLLNAPSIRSVRANPTTGSIILEHAGEWDTIAAFARERGLFEIARGRARSERSHARARRRKRPVHPMSVVTATLTALGVYQVMHRRLLGNAVESFWQGYRAYTALRKPWLSAAYIGMGLYQLASGRVLGPAGSLFFYAFNARKAIPDAIDDAAE